MAIVKLGVCEARHEMPVTNFVFGQTVNPTDVYALYKQASAKLAEFINDDEDIEIELYVTGLTVATLAIVHAAADYSMAVTAMHYDRETGQYYPQVVL